MCLCCFLQSPHLTFNGHKCPPQLFLSQLPHRDNPHKMYFAQLQCPVQGFSIYLQSCPTITTKNVRMFSSPLRKTVSASCSPLPGLTNLLTLSASLLEIRQPVVCGQRLSPNTRVRVICTVAGSGIHPFCERNNTSLHRETTFCPSICPLVDTFRCFFGGFWTLWLVLL